MQTANTLLELELEYYGHVDFPAWVETYTPEVYAGEGQPKRQAVTLRVRKSTRKEGGLVVCLHDDKLDYSGFAGFHGNRYDILNFMAELLFEGRDLWNELVREVQDGRRKPTYALRHLAPRPTKSP